MSSRPVWSTEQVLGQAPKLHRKTKSRYYICTHHNKNMVKSLKKYQRRSTVNGPKTLPYVANVYNRFIKNRSQRIRDTLQTGPDTAHRTNLYQRHKVSGMKAKTHRAKDTCSNQESELEIEACLLLNPMILTFVFPITPRLGLIMLLHFLSVLKSSVSPYDMKRRYTRGREV